MTGASGPGASSPGGGAGAEARPRVVARAGGWLLAGARCLACGYPMAITPPRCPVCGGARVEPDRFGPGGVVFSSTVLRVPVASRPAPVVFTYIDVDDGPRVLTKVADATAALTPGQRVRFRGPDEFGDVSVEVIG